jgi:hypothetical protein
MPTFLIAALRYWKLIGLGLLLMLLAVQSVRLGHAKNETERAKINLNECRQGRIDDRKAYDGAQRKAHEANEAEVKRISDEQEQINADAKSRYERDLSRLRAGGLRKDLAAPSRDSGSSKAGTVPETAPGADAEKLCVPRSEIMRAAEGELRLNSLIDWINEQLRVER